MSKRKRLSFEEKIKACELYDQGYGSQQSKKIDYLKSELNIEESSIFNLTVANESTAVPTPKMLTEYFGVLNDEYIELFVVKSKGLFKKEYSLEIKTYKIRFKDFKTAEFGRGNGILWLQTKVLDQELIFTSNWNLEGSKNFIKKLEEKVTIVDIKLLKR